MYCSLATPTGLPLASTDHLWLFCCKRKSVNYPFVPVSSKRAPTALRARIAEQKNGFRNSMRSTVIGLSSPPGQLLQHWHPRQFLANYAVSLHCSDIHEKPRANSGNIRNAPLNEFSPPRMTLTNKFRSPNFQEITGWHVKHDELHVFTCKNLGWDYGKLVLCRTWNWLNFFDLEGCSVNSTALLR